MPAQLSRFLVLTGSVYALLNLSCPQAAPSSESVPLPADQVQSAQEPPPASSAQVIEAVSAAPLPSAEPPEPVASASLGQEDEPPTTAIAEKQAPQLAAIAKEAWVFAKPSWSARKIGYLRAGAVVHRQEKPAGRAGCKGGWYGIEPRGFVCVGKSVSLETNNPVVEAVTQKPNRERGLPYAYAMSSGSPPPFYLRLPTPEEQQEVEPDLKAHLRSKRDMSAFEALAGPVPGALLYERTLPSLSGVPYGPDALTLGRPVARSGFGLLSVFEWTDRLFGVTTDLMLVPLDRTRFIQGSQFKGITLSAEQKLPVAFVKSRVEHRVHINLESRQVGQDAGLIAYREGIVLTGRRVRVGSQTYLEAQDGTFIRESGRVLLVPPIETMPSWAKDKRKWIDVSILRQSLVAYEGEQPVFATLVSTGADGLGDPKETHSTVQGLFPIHTKHVSATMDGDEKDDEFDLRDVPYVQYFTEGYAIHGAYWHDEFGTPHSHGCINVAPSDAAWLFAWTDPEVPEGWHARLELSGGTMVYIHP